MAYLYLTQSQARLLFLNKYLTDSKFEFGEKEMPDVNSFKLFSNSHVEKIDSAEVVFLSQFTSAAVMSEAELEIFKQVYKVPKGFLTLAKTKSKGSLSFTEKIVEQKLDELFLSYRNGFLNAFMAFSKGRGSDLNEWKSIFNNIVEQSKVLSILVPKITEAKDFPQVEMTANLATSSKSVLQFRFLGSQLGELFFPDNGGKNDDTHRNWLMALNPEVDLQVLDIPERFRVDQSAILGYILALKFATSNGEPSIHKLRDFLKAIPGSHSLSSEEVFFYCYFWLGVARQEYSSAFHTEFTASIAFQIERKAFLISQDSEQLSSSQIPDGQFEIWCSAKNKQLTGKSPIFKEYCKMFSGEAPKETSIDGLISGIQSFNLSKKKCLIVFFSQIRYLEKIGWLLKTLPSIEHVLFVWKVESSKASSDDLQSDLQIGNLRNQFVRENPKINLFIITKNVLDTSQRDIVNNLRGFLNQYCNDSNFLFISDSEFKKAVGNEYQWLAKAYSPNPVFDPSEDYLFIR